MYLEPNNIQILFLHQSIIVFNKKIIQLLYMNDYFNLFIEINLLLELIFFYQFHAVSRTQQGKQREPSFLRRFFAFLAK